MITGISGFTEKGLDDRFSNPLSGNHHGEEEEIRRPCGIKEQVETRLRAVKITKYSIVEGRIAMGDVSISDKKDFIQWFFNRYEVRKRESAWLLSYLSSDDELLKRVHFVENLRNLPKTIMISRAAFE